MGIKEYKKTYVAPKCGVVFFYHVGGTGGTSINKWLQSYDAPYFTYWGRGSEEGSKLHKKQQKEHLTLPQHTDVINQGIQDKFIKGTNAFLQHLKEEEWKIVHAHHNSLHLNVSEHLLYQWRASVEDQGCKFVACTSFRDALGHTLGLFRYLKDHRTSSRKNYVDF